MTEEQDYSAWSHEELQSRVKALDLRLAQLKQQMSDDSSTLKSPKEPVPKPWRKPKNPRSERSFDFSKYTTRLIALKFAYLGQNYNGLEFHANNQTPLPTIEEELWKALHKARLIFPTPNPALMDDEPNFDGCEYSKCGRTDKGVSAFGQVVGIRVRSNRPPSGVTTPSRAQGHEVGDVVMPIRFNELELAAPALNPGDLMEDDQPTPTSIASFDDETLAFDHINDEIPYCQVLNRLLPPDIRVLAWCPAPPVDFSARFSCKERQYKYYFTQPAFTPTPGPTAPFHGKPHRHEGRIREGYLDTDAMYEAAGKFVGLHDFRNFCKVDASKQIDNFERRIFHAGVGTSESNLPAGYMEQFGFQMFEKNDYSPGFRFRYPYDNPEPQLYAITIHGSAFLWHQVRHMAAILFLIGQGLESPSLVDDLLDINKTPCKPQYEMADDAPLVLWDCIFPRDGEPVNERTGRGDDALEWIYNGDSTGLEPRNGKTAPKTDGKFGFGGVVDDLWRVWRKRKMDEILAGSLLNRVASRHEKRDTETEEERRLLDIHHSLVPPRGSQRVYQGAEGPKLVGKYVPVLERPRMESVHVINERYARRKGFEQGERTRKEGWRKVQLREEEGRGT